MNFSIIWRTETLDALADIYIAATEDEREQITAGVDVFNRRLAKNPFDVGESRDGNVRFAFPALLMIRFRIEGDDRIVRVIRVARFGR